MKLSRLFVLLTITFLSVGLLSTVGCKRKTAQLGEKVFYYPMVSQVKGLDPAQTSDVYSHQVVGEIYEGLLQYHYLKRPFELIPSLAETLPAISADKMTYTFKIKKGVLFQDDVAFPNGKGRELVAEDFIYALKRVANVKMLSEGWWLFDGQIKGLNEFRDYTKTVESVDYSKPVEGLRAVDSHTLQITLTSINPQFLYALAMPFSFAVAHEVVNHYGEEFLNHPVGTGPFKLESWQRGGDLVLVKNPTFRKEVYPSEGEEGDREKGLLEAKGTVIPILDKVVIHTFVESQPQWLNFMKMNLDVTGIPKDNYDSTIDKETRELKAEFKDKGIRLQKTDDLDVTFTVFNMGDPLLGKNKFLRQAMSLADNAEKSAELFYNWRCTLAQSPIPPGLFGYDATFKNPYRQYNLDRAKELLAKAGYPEGKGLPVFVYETTDSTTARQMGERFVNEMAKIGINVKLNQNTWPALTQKMKTKHAQIFGYAWGADYPDAENFLQLFYGLNESPGSNSSNFKNPEYDALYLKMRALPDNNEKKRLIQQMVAILVEEAPAIWGVHRQQFSLAYDWAKNYKYHAINHTFFQYYDVDSALRGQKKGE